MKGDKILIKAIHKKKAKNILKQLKINPKMIIAIGGESGTGKTEVATVLRDLLYTLGYRVNILSLDDYYLTLPEERVAERQKSDYTKVGIVEIDWNFVHSIVEKYLRKIPRNIWCQRTNRYTNAVEGVQWNSKDVDILIIEGLFAGYLELPCVKVHIEGSIKDTLAFRVKRGKEKPGSHRNKVLKIEKREVKKLKKNADLIVTLEGVVK